MTLKNYPMPCLRTLAVFLLLVLGVTNAVFAQKDTEFWFVAPEISQGTLHYDRPVAFRFSTYGHPATITVSQPANPAFPVQIITVGANGSGILQFPPYYDFVENTPANTILNKGFLIKSTTPITAYYEVIGESLANPGLFSLKGKNALGLKFYVPFQTLLRNSDAYFPVPYASFDIVATLDNTLVTITPTKAILGHAANVPFSIVLNRGQTYSAEATSQAAYEHPTGSKVLADKPIAITIKDDLLDGGEFFGGFCRDMMGDQIVPVERTGTRYVLQKGLLNGGEAAFITATADGTAVSFDGVPVALLDAGDSWRLDVSSRHFLQSSAPIYVWQMTGNTCEVAGEILPALDCSGSNAVRFVRTINDVFHLFLVTQSGNQGGFSLNGSTTHIQAAGFQVVPGSNGEFVAATIEFSNTIIPTGQSSIVENSLGVFQMGFLNGGPVGNGSRFGFFSDFGGQIKLEDTITFCPGDTARLYGLVLSKPGFYQQTLVGPQGCDTLIEVTALLSTMDTTFLNVATCEATQVGVSQQILTNVAGCDSTIITTAFLMIQPTLVDTLLLCPGESIIINGTAYAQPSVVLDTLTGPNSCDTLATHYLMLGSNPISHRTISLCPGDMVVINGTTYTEADTTIFYSTPASIGCDTLVDVLLQYSPQPLGITKRIVFCPEGFVTIDGVRYEQPDTIMGTLPAVGCDTVVTYVLQLAQPLHTYIGRDTTIHLGDSLPFSALVSEPGRVVQYTWRPSIGVTCDSCPFTFAHPVASTRFTLYVVDSSGCISNDSRLVVVEKSVVFIPNVFAPHTDNENGHFTLYAGAGVEEVELMQVYDRWGSLVFEGQHFAPSDGRLGWDGKVDGQWASAGVYAYWIKARLRDGSSEVFKGDITLIR